MFSWEIYLFSPRFLEEILITDKLCSDLTYQSQKYQSVISNIFIQFLPRSNDMSWFRFVHSNSIQCIYYVNYVIHLYLFEGNIWDKVNTSMKHLKTLSINTKLKLLTVSWHFRTKRKLPVLKNYKCCPTKYLQYFFLFNSLLQVTGIKSPDISFPVTYFNFTSK